MCYKSYYSDLYSFQNHKNCILLCQMVFKSEHCSNRLKMLGSMLTDRQTDRQTEKCIKINQPFVITMSLNSDPKEICAKT